jgi:acid phosphatase (class A)
MRNPGRVFLLVLFLLLPHYGLAGETAFLPRGQIDFSRLLAPPPAVGSPRQQEETALLLALQKERTPAQEAFALADAERSVFRFADVLGPDFTPGNLPVTEAFFRAVTQNASALLGPAKEHWNRPRPYASNPEIHPCVPKPNNASYPSGHSNFATVTSILLANMLPEKQDQIYERAERYRFNREIGGVHYPSDVEAGRLAGTVIAAFLLEDQAFAAEFAKARAEVRQALHLD